MKRILIIILLIVSIWFAYRVVSEGFTIDKFNLDISSYEDVQKDSDKMQTMKEKTKMNIMKL